MLIFFRARSKQTAFLFIYRKGPRSRNRELQSLIPQAHTNLAQRGHRGDELELSSTQEGRKPWKRKLVSSTPKGWAGSPKSLKKEGKCLIRSPCQCSRWEVGGGAGTGHARSWRKGCFNPLPQDASLEWRQQLKFSTQRISLWGFYLVFFLSCWHPQSI